MKLYCRKCNVCGKGMNEGYIFDEGMAYACSKPCAEDYLISVDLDPKKEFEELDDALENGTDWFYWTDWSEDEGNFWEEMYFTEEGYVFNPEVTKKQYLDFFQTIGADFWGWLLDGLGVYSPMNVYETIEYYQNSDNSFELLLPEFLKFINKDPEGKGDLQVKLEKELAKGNEVTNRERGLYARAVRDTDLREDAESFATWIFAETEYNNIRYALVDNIAPNGEMTTEQLDVLIFQFYKSWWKSRKLFGNTEW